VDGRASANKHSQVPSSLAQSINGACRGYLRNQRSTCETTEKDETNDGFHCVQAINVRRNKYQVRGLAANPSYLTTAIFLHSSPVLPCLRWNFRISFAGWEPLSHSAWRSTMKLHPGIVLVLGCCLALSATDAKPKADVLNRWVGGKW